MYNICIEYITLHIYNVYILHIIRENEYSGRFYTSIPEIGNRRSDVKETALPF